MKTRINLYDHAAGLRDTIVVPLAHDVTVHRLQLAIGEPQADSYEIFDEDIAVYARVDTESITVHVFSYAADAAAAEWNRIVGTLIRKGVVA